ncbi:metallophosphoesterase [Pedobacter sp.]|uniref:metallophosphoesterase n=1 Tax=Pedobacter sp. TaxID=1411316 RepID=UPI003D7F7585
MSFSILWWSLSALALFSLFVIMYFNVNKLLETVLSAIPLIFLITKITLIPFIIIDDLYRSLKWLISRFFTTPEQKKKIPEALEPGIPRSKFILQLGIGVAAIPLSALTKGVISGAYDYQVKRQKLYFKNLPKSFEGIKVAQISDIHSGSFYNRIAVQGGVDLLLQEKPDVVFFTGDLVNDLAAEMKEYQSIFSKVKAPLGVFSILGNHDYGDYYFDRFKLDGVGNISKEKNFRDLKEIHKNMGWDLLLNDHKRLRVDNEEIAIIGVENWGVNNQNNSGRLDLAMKDTNDLPVKLLLSHDPSHWRGEVLHKYPQIDAMFSGHTHGGQFGVQTASFQWSPVEYRYKEWAGLYKEGNQQLYVNVGFGFLGYPGRFGILPEITIFEFLRG